MQVKAASPPSTNDKAAAADISQVLVQICRQTSYAPQNHATDQLEFHSTTGV